MDDCEQILVGWVYAESNRLGRELIEGLDYDVFPRDGALYIAYYTDPDRRDIDMQIFEITDLPVLH